MDYFMYNVELPFSGVQLWYKDISSKQQLALAKLNILYPVTDENYPEYSKVIKKIILESVENKKDFYDIDLIDYVLFLTKLRIVSIGNNLELMFKNSEDSSEETTKLTLDLNYFMKSLYEISSEAIKNNILNFKDMEVEVSWPNVKSEEFFLSVEKDYSGHVINSIPEYIKSIKIKNKKILTKDFTQKEKIDLYEKLPIKLKNLILDFVFKMIRTLSEKNLFGIDKMDYLKFNFYNKSHQHIIRLFFSENLRNIYQEYYVLAAKKINPSYVDNLSISERKVYCSFIQEELKAQNESSDNSVSDGTSTDLRALMDEFGE